MGVGNFMYDVRALGSVKNCTLVNTLVEVFGPKVGFLNRGCMFSIGDLENM